MTAWSKKREESVQGLNLQMRMLGWKSERKGIASMASSVQQNGSAKKGKLASLFEDLSLAQVIAGALAAATVFLLSSVIGVAGSLIGAAVGSVVSAVSSQVYKKMLSASADKLRDAAPGDAPLKQADPDETRLLNPVRSDKTHVIDVAKVDAGVTKVMGADDVRYQARTSGDKAVDPAVQRAHVRRHRKARVQRNVIIVSIVSALIAIAVSAGLIHVFTAGQGIGEKTEPIFTATDTAQTKQAATSESDSSKEKASAKESATTNTQGSSSDSGNSSNNSSSGSSGASNAGSGSSSGNSDSSSSGSGSSASGSGSDSGGSGSSSGSGSSGTSGSGSSSNGSSSGSGSGSTGSGSGSASNGSSSTESSNG